MSARTRYLLRLTSRTLRLVLPNETHRRLSITAKSALITYREARRRVGEDGQPVSLSPASEPASRPLPGPLAAESEMAPEPAIGRDAIAHPVAPFIGCDGAHVQPGLYLEGRLSTVKEKCKLVLCCAFSGRHRIVERIVRESIAANRGADVRWMLVGSSPEDLALIEALSKQTRRVAGFVVENRPLGRKWQSCLYFATHYYDSELFGITGSDDFVSSRLIDYVIGRHEKN